MQLRAAEGRVLLGGQELGRSELTADLGAALREWAAVADGIVADGDPAEAEAELVRRRGRQLAARVAVQQGVAVDYVDPVTGEIEPVEPPSPAARAEPTADRPAGPAQPTRAQPIRTGEQTPWATGLTVSAVFAVVVAVGDLALHMGFAESTFVLAYGLDWLPGVANLLVGVGLAPSLLLLRHTPFWRWPAYGVAAGLALAWFFLLLSGLLAPAAS